MPEVLKIIFKMRHRYPFFSAPFFRHQRPVRVLAVYLLLSAAGGKDKNMYFNQVDFGQRIRELRRTGGLTREALSEELNISTDQLRKIECGSRGPSLDRLISLAVYFDVSTDYLLMGRDYVNLHSRKRLEGVLQELSGIIADLQDV